MKALNYAGLVGKYIRMSRPATEEELTIPGHPETAGMECYCIGVRDGNYKDRVWVDILSDYGIAFSILPSDEHLWTFEIYDSEERIKNNR